MRTALAGLAVVTFAVAALSGPGRIDLVDGQTRYEVVRSWLDHGDSAVRDGRVWFYTFPGPGGRRYTHYRFPPSLFAVPLVAAADLFGPPNEGRRHLFYLFTSAAEAAWLTTLLARGFRLMGHSPRAAVGWAALGLVATPVWLASTTTFDDVLCALCLAGVLYNARRATPFSLICAGLWLATAVNAKHPLAAVALPAAVLADDPRLSWRSRFWRQVPLAVGLGIGVGVMVGYHWLKFPQGRSPDTTAMERLYVRLWLDHPLDLVRWWAGALVALAVSPGCGVVWYCPSVILMLVGATRSPDSALRDASQKRSVLLAAALYVAFVASMTIYKGDPAWGPRYLTPLLAVGWWCVPAGVRRIGWWAAPVIAAGVGVQLLALSIDPHRLFLEHRIPTVALPPVMQFNPTYSGLVQRPREIAEALAAEPQSFTPAWSPTAAPDTLNHLIPADVRPEQYTIFARLRPWWVAWRDLPLADRPVQYDTLLSSLLSLATVGGFLVWRGLRQ